MIVPPSAPSTSSLEHPIERDVRVDVAAAEKYRSAGKSAGVVARRAVRPDQSAAQADQSAIAQRVPRRVFEGEARALRKPENTTCPDG